MNAMEETVGTVLIKLVSTGTLLIIASDMTVAHAAAEMTLYFSCFACTLNLASQRDFQVEAAVKFALQHKRG